MSLDTAGIRIQAENTARDPRSRSRVCLDPYASTHNCAHSEANLARDAVIVVILKSGLPIRSAHPIPRHRVSPPTVTRRYRRIHSVERFESLTTREDLIVVVWRDEAPSQIGATPPSIAPAKCWPRWSVSRLRLRIAHVIRATVGGSRRGPTDIGSAMVEPENRVPVGSGANFPKSHLTHWTRRVLLESILRLLQCTQPTGDPYGV